MAEYLVLEVNERKRLVTLLDRLDSYHVARAAAELPPQGSYLHGPCAVRGFNLLVDVDSAQLYRMTFEAVHCGSREALARLHSDFQVTAPSIWDTGDKAPAGLVVPSRAGTSAG